MIRRVGGTVKTPKIWIYLGVLVLAAGSVLLAVAWGLAAGQTEVALQIPYVLSAGFPGIGLVVVGVGLVVVGVRETDARTRRSQQQELATVLTAIRDGLATKEESAPPARPRRARKATG